MRSVTSCQWAIPLLSIVFICLAGCSGSAWRYDPGIPGQVTGVTAVSGNGLVSLSWSANSVATGYKVYYALTPEPGKTGSVWNSKTNQIVISGLSNGDTYYFCVSAVNNDGEGALSSIFSATPGTFTLADLTGTWTFHTLVAGDDAQWMRGTAEIDNAGKLSVSDYATSSGDVNPPQGFTLSMGGDGSITGSGSGTMPEFHAVLGSAKNMIIGTFTLNGRSPALTIFQKRNPGITFSIADIAGNGISGNGPTRFVYHQLASGADK